MSLIYTVKKNYDRLPAGLLKIAGALYYCLPVEKRYGGDFEKTINLLKETEYLSKDEIDTIVNERFLYIVKYAAGHVPYYREKYAEYGVDMASIHDVRDIVKLPTIDKEELRAHRDRFISDEYRPRDLMYITTSGSTGNPVGFYQKKSMMMTEWAYAMHIWSRVGCKPDSTRLILRGKKIKEGGEDPHIFYDPLRRELNCDVFNMTEENLEKYCVAIEKYKPEFIHGYMSAIMLLAKYVESRGGGLKHQFKGILAISENVLQDQREYVEKVFNARVFSFYGHSERLVIAGECEKSSQYHVEPLYGYCELLDQNGEPAKEGEITGTGFLNEAMPLIRYRTGDVASWSGEKECPCGRHSIRLAGVVGRWNQDMLVNKEGALVSLAALNIHSDEFDHLIRYKLIQNEPGLVRMEIQPTDKFTDRDARRIKELLEQKSGGKICFDLHTVRSIPIMQNGKYRIVEQKIPDIMRRGGLSCKLILCVACFPVRRRRAAWI